MCVLCSGGKFGVNYLIFLYILTCIIYLKKTFLSLFFFTMLAFNVLFSLYFRNEEWGIKLLHQEKISMEVKFEEGVDLLRE